jgi:multidrug efflux pump subunit AcrA (membrane-fusion protein)
VNTDVGEMAGGAVVELISSDNLEGLLTVDEVDMAALDVKEPATVTLDTWPDTPLKGMVISIDPKSTAGSNADVVNFGVHISLEKSNLPLRDGMTINATITTFDLKGVLLVLNGAVTLENGKYYVNLITSSGTKKTEVKIGVHSNQYTQILSGLKAGDEVQANGLTAPVRTGGGFGGGGGARVPGD